MRSIASVAALVLLGCRGPDAPEPVPPEPGSFAVLDTVLTAVMRDEPQATVLPVALGDASEADPEPMSSYTYEYGSRTASTLPWLKGRMALGLVHEVECYAGEQFVAAWWFSVGYPGQPWPRPCELLVGMRPTQAAVQAGDSPRVNIDLAPWGAPGSRLLVLPDFLRLQPAGPAGDGILRYDDGGRVVLRWTPPEWMVGHVVFLQLVWGEPAANTAGIVTTRALQLRVGRRAPQ